jgi:superfamily II DNA or RNA helicase
MNAAAFRFALCDPENEVPGLRPPQIGGLHSVLAHWSVSQEAVTVVMPTGTGKTETMLALLAQGAIERLLVAVPSDPLREQTFRKFLTCGLLPKLGVLGSAFAYPVVARLEHELASVQDVDELFGPSNVIVATVQSLAGSHADAIARAVELCTHLFLDEAHHVAAPSWRELKAQFARRPVVQFTATPFRRDGRRVEGRIAYNYPLRKAQTEGYFAPIQYRPVFCFSREAGDRTIAETAIHQLREDREAGLDHILMARVDTIRRAEEVLEIYKELAPDLNPLIVHSGVGSRRRAQAMEALRTRACGIVVCVDMLGEGFDLPQLKIAAIHDAHKSLAITLQFTGRFTRVAADRLGPATMIANVGDPSMEHALRQLYAEDADWNRIIRQLGEQAIGSRMEDSEFLATFPSAGEAVPLESILPKMSAVAYRTACEHWTPELIQDLVPPDVLFWGPVWSDEHKVALFITREFEEVPWGTVRELQNLTWHLYLLFWDENAHVLYINSSNNEELHEELARVASDSTAERIHGEPVYRALYGVNRLVLMNLGLLHAAGRAIRHTMHNGSDVGEQLKPGQLGGKSKTNLFGRGYEDGERVSIGCSLKGRVWSYKAAESIPEWVAWCKGIGTKLLDESITEEQVLEGVLRPEPLTSRPALVPLALDWNARTYMRSESSLYVRVCDSAVPFHEAELRVVDHSKEGDIRFAAITPAGAVEYRASFDAGAVAFVPVAEEATVVTARGITTALSALFKKEPPTILFEQDTFVEDNLLFVVHGDAVGPYDREAITDWDWTGVDLSKESQGLQKRPDSIQRRVLDQVISGSSWEFVFDDDASGESADIVALQRDGKLLRVGLYHCKYAVGASVGCRIEDLYAVCGQAQKSIRWRESVDRLLAHLRLREGRRISAGQPSRIEKGDARILHEIVNGAHLLRPDYRVWIVQPGLSKSRASAEQLRLLGATELYLSETYRIPLHVIASA